MKQTVKSLKSIFTLIQVGGRCFRLVGGVAIRIGITLLAISQHFPSVKVACLPVWQTSSYIWKVGKVG